MRNEIKLSWQEFQAIAAQAALDSAEQNGATQDVLEDCIYAVRRQQAQPTTINPRFKRQATAVLASKISK